MQFLWIKKKSVSDWDSSISVDAASVSPSVVRNTVSCGECVEGIIGAGCPPLPQAALVSVRHFFGLLGNSAKNMVWKAHHNTDWTESVQVLVSYRQEFKVDMRKWISTKTVGSSFHLHCMNNTSMFSTTHQHHCVGHCRQNVRRLKQVLVSPTCWVTFQEQHLCVRKKYNKKNTSNRV